MRPVRLLALAGLTALSLTGAALAQPVPPGPPPGDPQGRGPHGGGPHGGDPSSGGMACFVQNGRLTDALSRAHWRLRITPEEDAAWTKMTQDITTALQPLAQDCGKPRPTATTLPDRLALMSQMGQQHQQIMAGVQQAVATMYAQLSPEQKGEADRMFRRRPWHGPGMMPRP